MIIPTQNRTKISFIEILFVSSKNICELKPRAIILSLISSDFLMAFIKSSDFILTLYS